MNKALKASQITALFGKELDDNDVTRLYKELDTIVLPTIDPEDYDEDEDDIPRYHDWVLVRRKGVELGFSEFYYQTTSDFDLWGEGELLLTQAYFYSGGESIEPFTGELPYGLSFSDTRDNVKHKLTEFENTRRSYLSDTWDVNGYRLNVQYNINNVIDSVACMQKPSKLRHEEGLPRPTLEHVIGYLGLAEIDTNFARLWVNSDRLEIEQINCINKKRYLNLKRSHGVYLNFSGKSHAALLKSITFYSDREDGAVAWKGNLPFGLSFDDDMAMLLNKMGEKATESSDLSLTCRRVWNLPEFTLSVLYSNVDNRVVQVKITERGYWHSTQGESA